MTKGDSDIRRLVSALPEIYQPIYSYPEFDEASSRRSEDRLRPIIETIQDYPSRPVRVLDLGCAQGYFAFKLDELGFEVTAVDSLRQNIELCRALNEKTGRGVIFEDAHADLEFASGLPDNHYDFVLVLNVLHHICHAHGPEYTHQLLRALAAKSRVIIMELARKEEPVYWADKLPDSPVAFVRDFGFGRQIADSPTHLSGVRRPMYVASDQLAYINRKYYAFDRHLASSHEFEQGAHRSTRRYCFGNNIFIKAFEIQGENEEGNRREIEAEASLLREHTSFPFLPKLIDHEVCPSHALLVRELLPGERLSQRIGQGKPYDADRIILDVLDILIELERQGLYHHDLRTWNVLVDEQDHARIIDFGAVDRNGSDSVLDGFLTFCHDTLRRVVPPCPGQVWPRRSPSLYPGGYRAMARYLNGGEAGKLSFSGAKAALQSNVTSGSEAMNDNDPYERLYARLESSANERFQQLYAENQQRMHEIQEVNSRLLADMRKLTLRAQLTDVLRKLKRAMGLGRL